MRKRYYPKTGKIYIENENREFILKDIKEPIIFTENTEYKQVTKGIVFLKKFSKYDYENYEDEKFVDVNDKDIQEELYYNEYGDGCYMETDDSPSQSEFKQYTEEEKIRDLEIEKYCKDRYKAFKSNIKKIVPIKELPMNLILAMGDDRHIPIIKFDNNIGNLDIYHFDSDINPDITISSDKPKIRGGIGDLFKSEFDYLVKFVAENHNTLLQYWVNHYDEEQVLQRLDFDV